MSTITLYVMSGILPTVNPPQNVQWSVYNTPDFTGEYSGFPGQLIDIVVDYTQDITEPSMAGAFIAGGDLTGTPTDQIVTALQGYGIAASAPADGYTLVWNGVAWMPSPVTAEVTLAGDVTGSAAATVVSKIQGVVISGVPVDGYVLEATTSTAASWQAPTIGFIAGGDLTGTSINQTVAKIQGVVISGTPVDGYVLEATSSTAASWQAQTGVGNSYGAYASRPSAGVAGRVYIPSDGPLSYVDNGSVWLPVIPGVITNLVNGVGEVAPGNTSPLTAYATSSYTTAITSGGTVEIQTTSAPSATLDPQLFDQAYTPGQTVTAWFDSISFLGSRVGIYLANSHVLPSTSFNMLGWALYRTSSPGLLNIDNFYYNGSWNAGSFSANPSLTTQMLSGKPIGLRFTLASGTTYNFQWSDGVTWNTLLSTDVSAYVGSPSHCGFYLDSTSNTNYNSAKLLAWRVA